MVTRLRAWSDSAAWVLADPALVPAGLRGDAVEALSDDEYARALDAAADRGELLVLRGGKKGERCVEVRVRTTGAEPLPFGDVVAEATMETRTGSLVCIGGEALPWWEPGAAARRRAVTTAEGLPVGTWRATVVRPRTEPAPDPATPTKPGVNPRLATAAAIAVPVSIAIAVVGAKQGHPTLMLVFLPVTFLSLDYVWRQWVRSRVEEAPPRPEERHLVVVLTPLSGERPTGSLRVVVEP